MKQIKLFTLRTDENLKKYEERINEAIKNFNVIDIKFASSMTTRGKNLEWSQDVLVIFEDGR